MSTTAKDIINSAFRLLGVLGASEVATSDEANNALSSLNDMLANWSTENLVINAKTNESFTLVAGQQSYTMGTGGNFNTTRPLKIENVILTTVNGSISFDLPVEILNQDQWANITVKTTQSNIPTKIFAQGTYPLETLWLWPVPNIGKTLTIWSWKPLSSFSSLTSTFDLPPGYQKAIRYNLAGELAPEYSVTPSELIVAQALESKANIKRMNMKPQLLTCDQAILPQKPTFNYLTGE